MDLILGKKRFDGPSMPIAVKSKLDWILSGMVDSKEIESDANSVVSLHTNLSLGSLMNLFWEIEAEPGHENLENQAAYYEKIYVHAVSFCRLVTHRFKSQGFFVSRRKCIKIQPL